MSDTTNTTDANVTTEGGDGKQEFYDSKIKTARFFFERMLPENEARFRMIMAGAPSLMGMTEGEF